MIIAVIHSLAIGSVTGLLMLISFLRARPMSSWKGYLAQARRFVLSALLLCGGMLYALPIGFVSEGIHAHQVTGGTSFLVFSMGYCLFARGIAAMLYQDLLARAGRVVAVARSHSRAMDSFCLRVLGARREYALLKARKALQNDKSPA